MISPEQAEQALKKVKVSVWDVRAAREAAKLGGVLAHTGRTLLGREIPYGNDHWLRRQKANLEAARQLDEMSATQRLKIFEVLFPKVAEHVETGWHLLRRLPYQSGYARKAFRAPNTPITSLPARSAWIVDLIENIGPYPQDITWMAAWAPLISRFGAADCIGVLLAAAIDGGGKAGDEVFRILIESGRGEHEIGRMGRHLTRGLLCASRPEGWEYVEKLLLAAQRQEGLRQVILETIDEAHPEAFRRMLRLILDENLARFSATVRAADVWFNLHWDAVSVRVVNEAIERVLRFLRDHDARAQAIGAGDAESVYFALWCSAFEDAGDTISLAQTLLSDRSAERRFAAVHLLALLGLVGANSALVPALDDENPLVAAQAMSAFRHMSAEDLAPGILPEDLFERIERALPRFPQKPRQAPPLVWPWASRIPSRQELSPAILNTRGKRPLSCLIPHMSTLDTYWRAQVVTELAKQDRWDDATRDTLFKMVGDPSPSVREAAQQGLAKCRISSAEAQHLEALLTRKAGDLRRGVFALLLTQKNDAVSASAQRLSQARSSPQRLGGIEMLRLMKESRRDVKQCRALGEQIRQSGRKLSVEEERQLAQVLAADTEVASLDDGLGLMDPATLTKGSPPRKRKVVLVTKATTACLKALDDLVHEHRETPIAVERWGERQEVLLGNADWRFPAPGERHGNGSGKTESDMPLRQVFETWWRTRPQAQRDADGFDLYRLQALHTIASPQEKHASGNSVLKKLVSALTGKQSTPKLQYHRVVGFVLAWLRKFFPVAGDGDFLLDAAEHTLAGVPAAELVRKVDLSDWREKDWRERGSTTAWLTLAREALVTMNDAQKVRLFRLLRWTEQPVSGAKRIRPYLEEILAAYAANGATDADIYDALIGPEPASRWRAGFHNLHQLSGRKSDALIGRYPHLGGFLERCRARILEIELRRGDTPTAASPAALNLRYTGGLDALVRLLVAFGKENFVRGHSADSISKAAVLSHLIRVTAPASGDTIEAAAKALQGANIPEKRLVELALYAPQWAPHVEQALKWSGLEDGVWWLHAHTKDNHWAVEQALREEWQSQVAERTLLTAQDLIDGAVDVAWFHRTYGTLGKKRWRALDDAAKYCSGGGGHKRAQLYAGAMLKAENQRDVIARITQKRHQDAVRALGLFPLAKGKSRENDLLARYDVIQDFLRTSRQFGSQRQVSEKRAATIALENLARTAGYPDPQRLAWALEAKALEVFAEGAVTVSQGEVQVTLAITDVGEAEMRVEKNGKTLAAIPSAVKKAPAVAALLNRKAEIRRQASRMRRSLEDTMCRGDRITGGELRELLRNPLLRPMLLRLVFIGKGIIGYPIQDGLALERHDGKPQAVGKDEHLALAHPGDLLREGSWHRWQADCFARERIQPFKQVFRELYVLTGAEKREKSVSRRYAGHQVQPRQALSLLGGRGWVVAPEEGVRRTFHHLGISAWLTFQESFFTPADVEGLTLEGVRFSRRGEWEPLALEDISPLVFSETMRDLDLVVSVAHRGGVDPEASASTVEMRAALARETCSLLKLSNVRFEGTHAFVKGTLGDYTVHLGSAVTHRQPGGALFIVAVHSQHRGRLFLPFADDDPRSAEVLAKILLLARDADVKDPNILDQIRG